ncbi:hypothetical protein FRX31_027108, partial [Thalictrum thalictroides]
FLTSILVLSRGKGAVVAEDDEFYVPGKRRINYRGSSSAFKNTYVEGLVVQPQCVINQENFDDWLCVPTEDECETVSISSSYPWNLEIEFFQI